MRTIRSVLAGIAAVVISLPGCGDEPPITVTDGKLTQITTTVRFPDPSPLDLLFVVDRSGSPEAAAVRAETARLVTEMASDLQYNDGRWNPVDVRAFVVNVGEQGMRSADDDIRLAWLENNASREGADRFASGLRDALTASSPAVESTEVLATLRLALGAVPFREKAMKQVVLVTGHDDPSAEASSEPRTPEYYREDIRYSLACANTKRVEGLPVQWLPDGWRLKKWADENYLGSSCTDSLSVFTTTSGSICTRRVIARRPDGAPDCRVRAIDPDAEVVYRDDTGIGDCETRLRDTTADSERHRVCVVGALTGEDRRRCSDPNDTCEGCASGWCVIPSKPWRCGGESLRFIGGSAPPSTTLELVCNVSR